MESLLLHFLAVLVRVISPFSHSEGRRREDDNPEEEDVRETDDGPAGPVDEEDEEGEELIGENMLQFAEIFTRFAHVKGIIVLSQPWMSTIPNSSLLRKRRRPN